MKNKRITNLDLFRAIAIILVILFHTTQMYFSDQLKADYYIWGKFGVEFFFILSGFLVGGLFYKQVIKVNLFRFWCLRFFRTYPPYIIALLLSYFAVYFSRKEHFDIGYLVFFQNFYTSIPYFKVSWSLCIEEHFYIVFPVFILLSEKILKKKILQFWFWVFLSIVPTILRWKFGNNSDGNFGYFETASIFKFEGISMGCLLSFIVYRLKYTCYFTFLSAIGTVAFFLVMTFINIFFKDLFFTYTLGYLLLNCSLVLLLSFFYFSNSFTIACYPIVGKIASMAYSIYLTHALIINSISVVAAKFKIGTFISYPFTIIAIFSAGYLFYRLVELPTIRCRNLYFYSDNLKASKFYKFLFSFNKPAL